MEETSNASEKSNTSKNKSFMGYLPLSNPLSISITAIFTVITFALTLVAVVLSQGFINIGDLGVMITGLLFGPIVGFVAGGIGPFIADLVLFPPTALFTLGIKALEGFLVGVIANPRRNYKKFNYRDIIAVVVGGLTMVFGYFFVELFFFGDPGWAFGELPFNFFIQFLTGVIGSIIFVRIWRKSIVDQFPQVFDKIFLFET
ncbi:hypothetical protein LCGC14_0990820 [marine sediment metagenome]|uniref:ECF transporter S component n=1 Tax=marine sediment metagenome TaxID=412755 RepID=A0A0F9N5S1_9ZZZZ